MSASVPFTSTAARWSFWIAVSVLPILLIYMAIVMLDPIYGILIPLGLIFTLIVWRYPYFGLYSALFFIPIDRMGQVGDNPFITFAKLTLVITFGVWLLKGLLRKDEQLFTRFNLSIMTLLGVLFIFISLASIFNAESALHTLGQTLRRASGFILFLVITNMLRKSGQLHSGIWSLVVGGYIASFSGIYELMTGQLILSDAQTADLAAMHAISEERGFRVMGVAGDPDFYGGAMAIYLLLAGYLLRHTRHIAARIALLVMSAQIFYNILATGSRGAMLLLLIGAFLGLLLSSFKRKTLVIAGLSTAFLVTAGLFVLTDPNQAGARFAGADLGTFAWRYQMMEVCWNMIKAHPWLGIGTGNFAVVYFEYVNIDSVKDALLPSMSFMQAWAESGVFGLLIYCSLFVAILWILYRTWQHTRMSSEKDLAAILLGLVVGLAVWAGTINVLENELYWLVFALAIVLYDQVVLQPQLIARVPANLQTGPSHPERIA